MSPTNPTNDVEQANIASASTEHDAPDSIEHALSGQKRKNPENKKKQTFKAVAHLVMAMKRFQGMYTYGI